jgi:hypothetical protein
MAFGPVTTLSDSDVDEPPPAKRLKTTCTPTPTPSPSDAKPATCSKPHMLHLFAGSGHLDKVFKDRGWDVTSVDILTDPENNDLSKNTVFDRILKEIRALKYDYVHAGPPCSTYSTARFPKIRSSPCLFIPLPMDMH